MISIKNTFEYVNDLLKNDGYMSYYVIGMDEGKVGKIRLLI